MDNLDVMGLHKNYEGKPLLCGVSFHVESGEILCLLGSSGSGKSTILRIIAGIEKPESGSVLWNGKDLVSVPVYKRNFGLMFQDYALFPHLNVRENVGFGLKRDKLSVSELNRRVSEALEQVNMLGFEDRRVTDLSGGEQQRIALARALAPRPGLLMLDEPLAALDRSLRVELQEQVRDLLRRSGIPAIYVTHDQEEAIIVSDRLALLNEGRIVQCDRTENVFDAPVNQWAARFLGMNNFLKGTIISVDPIIVRTVCGDLKTQELSADRQVSVGDEVTLLVKPTGVTFNEPDGQQSISVIVRDAIFRGDHYRLTVQACPGIVMDFNVNGAQNIGASLRLNLSPSNVICLRD